MNHPEADEDWTQYRQDLEDLERQATDAILHAHKLGLPDDECMAIAFAAGLPTQDIYKEIHK